MALLNLKDGGSIYYEIHGDGEPLILLNGLMMNTLSWMDFIPQLADKFKLILFDFRDQGRSSKLTEGYDNSTILKLIKLIWSALLMVVKLHSNSPLSTRID
jgi:pimeloyl-ACP methyl ester carboxylesterase